MILRLQASFLADSAAARDRLVITPHFQLPAVTADADDLCTDLAAALSTWAGSSREVIVKAYDAQGTVPVFPIGSAVAGNPTIPTSQCPREVACCLSYYSERNLPRYRGRLYIPQCVTGGSAGVRPNSGQRAKIGEVAGILAGLGGVDVDWVVFSRADNVARPVSNWWVDDEWDTIRSRGLRGTERTLGTVSEQAVDAVLEACVPIDWTDAATATIAAIVAVSGTVAAKHRPQGARTRVSDRAPAADDFDADDLIVWEEGHVAEPLAGWPPRRAGSRLRRAADELRGRPG